MPRRLFGSIAIALTAPVLLTQAQDAFSREETLKANWITTDKHKACQGSLENVKPYDTRQFVATAFDCMRDCEGRWGCLAVDYYTESLVCHFYQDACTTPTATADGASSYRIKRPGSWSTISLSAACEGSGIPWFKLQQNVPTSNGCRELCENRAGCSAVDFYSNSGICFMYKEACVEPKSTHDGAESYRIQRPVRWLVTAENRGCEGNKDKVEYQDKRHMPDVGLAGCKRWCERRSDCRGVDYYSTGWCLVYDHACLHPISTADGVQSWHVHREGLPLPKQAAAKAAVGVIGADSSKAGGASEAPAASPWSVIDDVQACLTNKEGIKHFKHVDGPDIEGFDVEACQHSCENHAKCTAVDWYEDTKICLLYSEACTTPTADHDGGYALKLFRSDLVAPAGEETEVTAGATAAAASVRGAAGAARPDPHQL